MRDFFELVGLILTCALMVAGIVYGLACGIAKDVFFLQQVGWWPW